MIDIEKFQEIKKTIIIALFSDDYLMNKLVLKGGTCIEFAYKLHHRSSKDIDFSIEDDFSDKDLKEIEIEAKNKFIEYFEPLELFPFDIKIKNRPVNPENIKMSGYDLSLKLIDFGLYEKFKNNEYKMRNNALSLGDGDKKDFIIEISKFEYIEQKEEIKINNHKIFVYSPFLVICEKLRAICQKMKEYRGKIGDLDLPRARDFYDIYVVNENIVNVDFKNTNNRIILKKVFKAKEVDLKLLAKIKEKRAIHENDFTNVLQTDIKQKGYPIIFDFYFEYVLKLVDDLEEFWEK